MVYKCEVCRKHGRSWGKPGTLAGCYPFFAQSNGKVRLTYLGFIHKKCLKEHWPKEIKRGVNLGWLIPKGDGQYEVAPQYR